MRILAYRFSAFGDVAMVATVLREFLSQNPSVEIIFVSRPNFAPLFEEMPNLKFYGIDLDQLKGVSHLMKLAAELHHTFKPDYVADLHDVIRTKLLNLYFRYKKIPLAKIDKGSKEKKRLIRDGANRSTPLLSMHERYANVFRKIGFSVQLSHTLSPKNIQKSGIGFAPFAQHQGKILPLEKSFALAKTLASTHKLYLFGGRGEEENTLKEWAKQLPNTQCVAGKLSLPEELSLIASLELMISMDSANMHLASWVGTRCLSIWGATHHYAGFLGYGQKVEDCIQNPNLDCRPCSVFGNKPCKRGDYQCLHSIKVEDIAQKTNEILSGNHTTS